MSWSVNESSYPESTSVATMEKEEFAINYQNRGSYEPQPIHIRVLDSSRVFSDMDSARDYILDNIRHGESACVKYKAPTATNDKKSKDSLAKIQKEIASLRAYAEKHVVTAQKATFVSCKHCGSKLARTYIKQQNCCVTTYTTYLEVTDNIGYAMGHPMNRCPVCGEYLQNETVMEEIRKREKRILAIRDEYKEHIKTRPGKVMWFVYSQLYIG